MSAITMLRRSAAGLACLAMLASCSNAPERQVSTGSIGKAIFRSASKPQAPDAQKVAADITRALAATDAPLMLLAVPERKAVTVIQHLEQNRGYDTYGTADRRSITLRGGMLSATRGLGNDLMSSDITAVRALVAARRSGTAERVMRYLDGEDLTQSLTSTCIVRITGADHVPVQQVNIAVTNVEESCQGEGGTFSNSYKVAPDGRIVQSRQWQGPLNKYLHLQTLR